MALGEQVALEPLEPADRLVQQAADLGDVARDGEHLGADALLDRVADPAGERDLELGRRRGERLEPLARPLERGLEGSRVGAARGGLRDALPGALECELVHGREATVAVG